MQTVVFLLYHGTGHINACLKAAKILKSKNHKVVFAIHSYFKNYVTGQGIDVYPLSTVPFALGFETWVNTNKKESGWWHDVMARWKDTLYRERVNELGQMIVHIEPTTILIDSWQSTDLVVLYRHLKERNIKVAFIQTMLSTWYDNTIPPLNSTLSFEEYRSNFGVYAWTQTANFFRSLKLKAKYLGMDNMALLKRRLRSNSIPREYSPRKNSLFSTTFTEVPELILSQAEFDLHDRHDAHQQHVGFMVDMSRTHASEATFFKWTSLHLQDRPLVYCAFGTVPSDNVHDVANFLRILIDVVKNNNYACAITCQASLISQFKNYEDASILLSEQLPQLAVLKLAKVFITHGGLNSIKESIIMKVPMIVYPVNKKTDQNGNATRVVNHRLGLRGDLRKDSRAEIENKLKRVLNDSSFQESSNPFLARDLRYDGKFLDAFNNLGVLK